MPCSPGQRELSCTGEGWKAGVTALGTDTTVRMPAITYYSAYKTDRLPFGGISADFPLGGGSLRFL